MPVSEENFNDQSTCKVIDIIFRESKKCLKSTEGVNFENKIILSIGIRLKTEQYIISKIKNPSLLSLIKKNQTIKLIEEYKNDYSEETKNIKIFEEVNLMTPANIHLNAFMYEPILDMSDEHLKDLYRRLCKVTET